jgi:hypothetical protein
MWSETFFQNASDSLSSLLFGRLKFSLNDLEFALYSELKSDDYAKYLDAFIDSKIDYPRVEIDICSSSRRMPLVKN